VISKERLTNGSMNMTFVQSTGERPGLFGAYVIAVTILTFIVFGPALAQLGYRWLEQGEYSHGILLPIVSLWLLWERRTPLEPNWLGPVLILLSGILHIIGQTSAIHIFSWIGFVIALFGIVLGAGGYPLLRLTLTPIAILLFAIPLPSFLDTALTLRLQLVSSQLGVFFIRTLGIPVFLSGNIIDLGNYKLQIVEACSGLRYVLPLLSLSFLAAYIFHAPLWQRLLVFVSSIPIAIGMNGVRIGLLGALVDKGGPQLAEGALHFFEGWIVFVACGILLILEMRVLAAISGKRLSDLCYLPQISSDPRSVASITPAHSRPLIACLLLIVGGGVAVLPGSGRPATIKHHRSLIEFPAEIAGLTGHPSALDPEITKFIGVDDYFLADYGRPNAEPINLYVAYYADLSAKGLHSPMDCLPAGGWEIVERRRDLTHIVPFNRMIIEDGMRKQLVYYWYNEQGTDVASEFWANLHRFANSLVQHRSDAALVRLVTEIRPEESPVDADKRLQSFMDQALPRLVAFLPERADPANNNN
jgi:exosortase D (VPLPA-CTERM-specific)